MAEPAIHFRRLTKGLDNELEILVDGERVGTLTRVWRGHYEARDIHGRPLPYPFSSLHGRQHARTLIGRNLAMIRRATATHDEAEI